MDNTLLAEHVNRPAPELFYRRNDPSDVRLGELVQSDLAAYSDAQVVILGCPQDEGVRRNQGRVGAAQAPTEIRRCLYRLGSAGLERLPIVDLGDTIIQGTLEETHALHQELVQRIISDGKRLIVLGGGNDISYPDCMGLIQAVPHVLALNIDAHYDVRSDTPRNSGTPYRQLLDQGSRAPEHFCEIGAQPFANSPVYTQYLRERGVRIVPLREARERGLEAVVWEIVQQSAADAVFWGFDMDVVRAADAPGVSAPNPLGMTGEEFCALAALAGRYERTRVVEFTEVNPRHDIDLRTCRLAAVALWHVLAAIADRV